MNTNDRPNYIRLDEPVFPYLVAEPNAKATSYITVYHLPTFSENGGAERTLFYLPGASLDKYQANGNIPSTASIKVKHSFARDVEGDVSYVASLEMSSLELSGAYNNQFVFYAWLTSVKFYPAEYKDERYEEFNPFVGAEDKGYDRNLGFPYLPPTVNFGKALSFPLQVEIVVAYNYKGNLMKQLNKTMVDHATEQAKKS